MTGAAGAVGKRVISRLITDDSVTRVVALDREHQEVSHDTSAKVELHQVDLMSDDIDPLFEGCDSIIHLAEDRRRRSDRTLASRVLRRILDGADATRTRHLVLLSSALVYGARTDNPVPITESHPLPINASMDAKLAHAAIKARLEIQAAAWAQGTQSKVAVLRPTAALSETDASWIGSALRAAVAIRPDQIDPPVQFLHHDDLADAAVLAAVKNLDSIYNVAPDGWIEAEVFRALRGETEIRFPSFLGDVRLRAVKALANRTLLDGLEPFVRYPWVISNDRLKAEGWQPVFTNEEAYVAGSATPLLSSIGPQRRQEIALGAAGTAGMAAVGGALWLASRSRGPS